MPPSDLSQSTVTQAYKVWAPFYDTVFGMLLSAGRKHAVRAINQRGGRLLEVGVGTGITLPEYSRNLRISGMDISPEMLAKAEERKARQKLDNVEDLRVMDAEALDYPDSSFDIVVAMYVITVVPHPEKVMAEMARVCRDGGEVIVVNHFASNNDEGVRARVERTFGPRAKKLGWRWDFPRERVTHPDLSLVEEISLKPLSLFTLLRFAKGEAAASEAAVA